MKKIAVIRCLRTSAACGGSGCLRAFQDRTDAFVRYGTENLRLVAFLTCNGCGNINMPDAVVGMEKKLRRLEKLGVDVVHLSHCTYKKSQKTGERRECPYISGVAEELERRGITVVRGTHGKLVDWQKPEDVLRPYVTPEISEQGAGT